VAPNPYKSPESEEPSHEMPRRKEEWYWLAGDIVFVLVPVIFLLVGTLIEPEMGMRNPASTVLDWLRKNPLVAACLYRPWIAVIPLVSWIIFRAMKRRLFTTYW
jgi:hypothetical protein